MLSKREVRLLSHLVDISDSPASVGDLADALDWDPGHASRVVSALAGNGCVQTETAGREKYVSLAETEPIEEFEALVTEYGHVDFPELIAGAGLQILYYLDEPRTATELTERSGVGRSTVYRRLDELQAVGIVGKATSRYRLNDQFSSLSSIARGLYHQKHRREARQHAGGVSILWETHDEYLFGCDDEIELSGFHLTGPGLFGEYGVQLLTRERRHYVRSERLSAVSPAALVCHTLLIEDSSRYRTYCLLLIQAQEIEASAVRSCADHYQPEAGIDLRGVVDDLLAYLDTEGAAGGDRMPEWEAFKRTAADYEITL